MIHGIELYDIENEYVETIHIDKDVIPYFNLDEYIHEYHTGLHRYVQDD
jgi:hypothetical protein